MKPGCTTPEKVKVAISADAGIATNAIAIAANTVARRVSPAPVPLAKGTRSAEPVIAFSFFIVILSFVAAELFVSAVVLHSARTCKTSSSDGEGRGKAWCGAPEMCRIIRYDRPARFQPAAPGPGALSCRKRMAD